MTDPGLHKLQCEVCGAKRDVEVGIKTMYCCAQKMVEVAIGVEEAEEKQEPTLKLKSRE